MNIDEDISRPQTEFRAPTGMKDAGYTYVNIDDGFFGERAPCHFFETADSNRFAKMTPGNRPPGWMRLEVPILLREIRLKTYWV